MWYGCSCHVQSAPMPRWTLHIELLVCSHMECRSQTKGAKWQHPPPPGTLHSAINRPWHSACCNMNRVNLTQQAFCAAESSAQCSYRIVTSLYHSPLSSIKNHPAKPISCCHVGCTDHKSQLSTALFSLCSPYIVGGTMREVGTSTFTDGWCPLEELRLMWWEQIGSCSRWLE